MPTAQAPRAVAEAGGADGPSSARTVDLSRSGLEIQSPTNTGREISSRSVFIQRSSERARYLERKQRGLPSFFIELCSSSPVPPYSNI